MSDTTRSTQRKVFKRRAESMREFAESIGMSYDSVFRAAKDGRLKTVRFGKRRLVPADEADRVMRDGL